MEIKIDPDKSRRNARKIAEIYLKRELQPGECVHHINGDPRDNRIENLIVFSSNSAHQKFGHNYKLGPHGVKTNRTKDGKTRKKVRSAAKIYRQFRKDFYPEEDIILYGPKYKKARLARLERLKEQTKRDLGLTGGQDGG